MKKEDAMTVNDLLELFQKLSKSEKGYMKIRCTDGFLHRDEIKIDYLDNEIILKGFLFNQPISDKILEFCGDIKKAERKFFDSEVTE